MKIKKTNGKTASKTTHMAAKGMLLQSLIISQKLTVHMKKETFLSMFSVIGIESEEFEKDMDKLSELNLNNLLSLYLAKETWDTCYYDQYDNSSVWNYFSYLLEME
jgi:hypothetical protein